MSLDIPAGSFVALVSQTLRVWQIASDQPDLEIVPPHLRIDHHRRGQPQGSRHANSLYTASKGRSSVSVAHRPSTIQEVDNIFVPEACRQVENGTHSELLQLKGRYSQFVAEQDLGSGGV